MDKDTIVDSWNYFNQGPDLWHTLFDNCDGKVFILEFEERLDCLVFNV